jgi:uncharacterized protein (TIGR00369 family)
MSGPSEAAGDDLLERGMAAMRGQAFSRLLGTRLVDLKPGFAELNLPITDELKQQHDFVHGGVLSYLADNALTFAGGAQLGAPVVTSEMKINYLRPATGDMLIARAQAIGSGRLQAVVRCDVVTVHDGVERLCAAAQGTITRLGTKSDADLAVDASST